MPRSYFASGAPVEEPHSQYASGGHVTEPEQWAEIRDGRVFPIHPDRDATLLAALNRASAVTPPPVAADAPTPEPDDTTAIEGDVAAIALAAQSSSVLLGHALQSLDAAEVALLRALSALSFVGVDDPARANVDRVFVDVTRVKNGLAGVAEELQNLGVLS